MNTILPIRQTEEPSRVGLAFHEMPADGLIHTAAVFGLEPDKRFVERVAALVTTWSERARAYSDLFSADLSARRLSQLIPARTRAGGLKLAR